MFVGRKDELNKLNQLYKRNEFQMVVIYGRRRIGKTTLINEFVKNKKAIFFSAEEATDVLNLETISNKIFDVFNMPKEQINGFKSWNDVFSFLGEKSKDEKIILVIDEFPYVARANKSLKSILQNSIDHILKDSKLFLILCGSEISFMEEEVLGYKSSLFGRRTAQIKLDSFDYYTSSKMVQSFSNEDKIKLYSVIGGTPYYLSKINENLSFEENVKELYFNKSGYLYDEPMMLLRQELREPAMYNSIITAIASGASKLNEISSKIGEDTSKTIKYISTLINLQILYKEFPFGEDVAKSKRGIYKISDNCYRFWYRNVFLNKSGIENGIGDKIAKNVLDNINIFIGKPAFEEICLQYVIRKNAKDKLPFLATRFGNWWGNDIELKQQADIDIVADNKEEKKVILGECKWRNNINDVEEIKKLMDKKKLLSQYDEYYFYFFSKEKFSIDAKNMEKENKNLVLIDLDMLFN